MISFELHGNCVSRLAEEDFAGFFHQGGDFQPDHLPGVPPVDGLQGDHPAPATGIRLHQLGGEPGVGVVVRVAFMEPGASPAVPFLLTCGVPTDVLPVPDHQVRVEPFTANQAGPCFEHAGPPGGWLPPACPAWTSRTRGKTRGWVDSGEQTRVNSGERYSIGGDSRIDKFRGGR